ncbi:MAG: hypothetical protein QOE25_676 [Actinomycetota bacterium]|jgi:hypothetical protein|nr:hypothetical protein [Actinomycetota bacterium]
MRKPWNARVVIAVVVAAALTTAVPAFADGNEVDRRGPCSGRSDWRLRVRREDDGHLRVRFEIEGGASGQEWHVFMSDNGIGIFSGTRTSGSGGHVEVRIHLKDRPGPDAVKAAANDVVTGETCSGRATL